MVGPAQDAIPSAGWGAVEQVIDEQSTALTALGYGVTILNSGVLLDWLRVRPKSYDLLIVHYERWLPRAFIIRFFFKTPVVCCSHYAYQQWPTHWASSYSAWFQLLIKSDCALALNPVIRNHFLAAAPSGCRVVLSPNGSNFAPNIRAKPTRGVVVLGRVEIRKRQFEVYQQLKSSGIDVSFVGDISDDRVSHAIAHEPEFRNLFMGAWTRNEVAERLSEFSVLLLASDGEADSLALYEAQLAGLSVIITKNAIGSQFINLPWIYTVKDDLSDLKETIELAIRSNPLLRPEIIKYSVDNYSWEERIKPIESVIKYYSDRN